VRQKPARLHKDFIKMPDALLFDFSGTVDAVGDRWAVRFLRLRGAGGKLALEPFEPLFHESNRRLELEPAVRSMGFGR
jgi:hypothetical protein